MTRDQIIERFKAVSGTRFVSVTVSSPMRLRKGAPDTNRLMRMVVMVGADYHRPEGVEAMPEDKKWYENVTPGLIAHKKTGALYVSGRVRSQVNLGYEPEEPLPEHRLAPRKPSDSDWKQVRVADLIEVKGLPELEEAA